MVTRPGGRRPPQHLAARQQGRARRRRGGALALVAALALSGCGDGEQEPAAATGPCGRTTSAPAPLEVETAPAPRGFDTALVTGSSQYAATGLGSLWLPAPDGRVLQLDEVTGEPQAAVDLSRLAEKASSVPHVQGVAVAGEAVWAAATRAGSVVCIDPATGGLGEPVQVEGEPYALAGDGDAVWVTDFRGHRVLRVARDGVTTTVEDVKSPTGIAVGAGSVWVAEHRSGVVVRLDPATGAEQGRVQLAGTLEQAAFGLGALWVAGNTGQSLHRVDPATLAVRSTPLDAHAYGVAVADDAVWVAAGPQQECGADDSFLVEVDPATGQVRQRTALECAFGVAVAGGEVWGMADTLEPLVARLER